MITFLGKGIIHKVAPTPCESVAATQTINEEEEEDVISPELERLIAKEESKMKPHQEEIELINLETREGKK